MDTLPPLSQIIPTPLKDATCRLLLESGFVVKHGPLHKKQSDRKKRLPFGSVLGTKWKSRFVVVSKGCVYMFKTESSTHSQRSLSLFGFNEVSTVTCNSSKSERFKFVIKDALEDRNWNRTVGFYANSEDDRKEWMECFRTEIFSANVHLYHSFGGLSMPRSSSTPSVGGRSSPVHLSESSASLSTIMGSLSAINLHKIQESLRKSESPSSDEDDDYTEIIDDDEEEVDDSPKKFHNIRTRPPLPIPSELTSEDVARQKRETTIHKRNSCVASKPRTSSCHTPKFSSCTEFRFPPDHCLRVHQPRSHGSQSELQGLSSPPSRSPNHPVSPKSRKPLPPAKPPKPVPAVRSEIDPPPPLPNTVDADCPAIPPKIPLPSTRNKPLPPLPITESPILNSSLDEADTSTLQTTSPSIFSQKADDDDDEFKVSPLVQSSFCSYDVDEAQRIMLEIEEDGVFMIRKATDDQDYKTLMVRCGPRIRKYKIVQEEGELYSLHLGTSGFRNITELLLFYFDNPVPNQSVKLTKPFTEVETLKY